MNTAKFSQLAANKLKHAKPDVNTTSAMLMHTFLKQCRFRQTCMHLSVSVKCVHHSTLEDLTIMRAPSRPFFPLIFAAVVLWTSFILKLRIVREVWILKHREGYCTMLTLDQPHSTVLIPDYPYNSIVLIPDYPSSTKQILGQPHNSTVLNPGTSFMILFIWSPQHPVGHTPGFCPPTSLSSQSSPFGHPYKGLAHHLPLINTLSNHIPSFVIQSHANTGLLSDSQHPLRCSDLDHSEG